MAETLPQIAAIIDWLIVQLPQHRLRVGSYHMGGCALYRGSRLVCCVGFVIVEDQLRMAVNCPEQAPALPRFGAAQLELCDPQLLPQLLSWLLSWLAAA